MTLTAEVTEADGTVWTGWSAHAAGAGHEHDEPENTAYHERVLRDLFGTPTDAGTPATPTPTAP